MKRRRRTPKPGVVEVVPLDVLQIDVNNARSGGDKDQTVLYAGNDVVFPYLHSLPEHDTKHMYSKHCSRERDIEISKVCWGECYNGGEDKDKDREWVAWGTEGGLVRVRRVSVPLVE